jgi:RNA polymerase sigma factor for flagellar operon FliA
VTYRDERDRLILEHRGLVLSIAKKLKATLPQRIQLSEMVGYGLLVLVECAMRFDKTRGVTFRTYASHRIRGGIKDALYREDLIPRSVRRAASKNGDSQRLPKVCSLDGEGMSWRDMLEDRSPGVLDYLTDHEFPDAFIDSLQRNERKVLVLCFTKSYTARRAADELGLSPSRVRQIRTQVVKQARRYYTDHGFNGFH